MVKTCHWKKPVSGGTLKPMKKINAVIFDLDNTLVPGVGVDSSLFEPVFEALRSANQGVWGEAALAAAFSDFWRWPLDVIQERHGFTPAMRRAAWAVYRELEVEPRIFGYSDIGLLATIPVDRFLVTTGFRRLQESKIRALGIRSFFKAIFVDDLEHPQRPGKVGLFKQILRFNDCSPAEILVVGDNPESEIDAGNRIGMPTVQILRPGIPPAGNATYQITGLAGLAELPLDFSTQDVRYAKGKIPGIQLLLNRIGAIRFPAAPIV
jgi:FMN phosphatase YigB (HAD superfamily)